MPRRRLRVVCSSDEEDDYVPPPAPPPQPQQQQQQQVEEIDDIIIDDIETDFQTVTLNSRNPTPATANSTTNSITTSTNRYDSRHVEPIPIDISDDDEANIIIGDATNNSGSDNVNGNNSSYFEVSESPVHGVLERLGLRLRREWLDSCLNGLQSSVQGFQRMDDSAKAKLCFKQFLWSDMNYCGAGVLPPNVHKLHLVDLKGPFVLQVDEIVNISNPLRERYRNAAPGSRRCLKLSMTDGVQRVFGMEYRPIKDVEVLAPAGLKVVICNVNIRHGLLMLVPEVIEVLGGTVEELEAARQRLVNEINKPPRGKRNRTGVVPPLATRATLAAWPPRNDAVPGHEDRNPVLNTTAPQASGQGSAGGIPANDTHKQDFATPFRRNIAEPNMSGAAPLQEQTEVPRHTEMHRGANLQQGPDSRSRDGNDMHRQDSATSFSRNNAEPNMSGAAPPQEQAEVPRHTEIHRGPDSRGRDFEVPVGRSNAEPSMLSVVQPLDPQHIDEPATEVMTPSGGNRQVTPPGWLPGEDVTVPVNGDNAEPNTSSIPMDVEEISKVDELERQFILCRDKEIPFTYLASLSAKLMANDDETSVVRGKIKCFLTGVKGFQYKERTTYELRAYVDDGSLISEILIDHNVVRNGIGYSPQEVTSALASSDSKRVSEMKETLKQFQRFLANFEGTMTVEMSKASPVPVAVEMSQGCPAPDAWLLLKRVKSFTSSQLLNPIGLSP